MRLFSKKLLKTIQNHKKDFTFPIQAVYNLKYIREHASTIDWYLRFSEKPTNDELIECYGWLLMEAVDAALEYAKNIDPEYLEVNAVLEALKDCEVPSYTINKILANAIRDYYIKVKTTEDQAKIKNALMRAVRKLSDGIIELKNNKKEKVVM